MYSGADLKNLVHAEGLTQRAIVMFALGCNGAGAKSTAEIRGLLVNKGGLKKAKNWNIAAIFSSMKKLVVHIDKRWELTDNGLAELKEIGALSKSTLAAKVDDDLSALLIKVTNKETKAFVEEALNCFRSEYYRAAVVLSWVGAIYSIYVYVHASKLSEFNAAADARFNKTKQTWKAAKTIEDLADMGERNFLQILKDIGLIGSSVKGELIKRLDMRNGCGHPNDYKVGESGVAHHLEMLILHVYEKYI